MPQDVKLYRILIASPQDVDEERKIIPDIIHKWNSTNSFHYAASLEPVMWETHSTPELGDRPQGILNKQVVDNCDVLIGVFWTRLGTPTGVSASGTVEEIERFKKDKKPVMLYFSSKPVIPGSVDKKQYDKLVEYKDKCKKDGLVSEYDSPLDFQEKVRLHLASKMNNLHGAPSTKKLKE